MPKLLSEKIVKRGDKWCTIHCHGKDAGKTIACFDTKEKALAQLKAIKVNEAYKTGHEVLEILRQAEELVRSVRFDVVSGQLSKDELIDAKNKAIEVVGQAREVIQDTQQLLRNLFVLSVPGLFSPKPPRHGEAQDAGGSAIDDLREQDLRWTSKNSARLRQIQSCPRCAAPLSPPIGTSDGDTVCGHCGLEIQWRTDWIAYGRSGASESADPIESAIDGLIEGQYVGNTPRGGCPGFMVTTAELRQFAKKKGTKYIDQYIPFKGLTGDEKDCSADEHGSREAFDHLTYWEAEDGAHGWACGKCGKVLQWG